MDQLPIIIYRGLLIGILVSAPMGPIGMLVIQRTLNKGRWPAFFTGLGAALSDLFYSLLTGLSLSFVTDFITANHVLLQIIGSVVFIAYGIYLFNSNPTRTLKTQLISANSWWKDFATGFLLTVSNPLIVFLSSPCLPASIIWCRSLKPTTMSLDMRASLAALCCGGLA